MKDFEVCILHKGKWHFDQKLICHNRKSAMERLRSSPDYREGCFRVRLLK